MNNYFEPIIKFNIRDHRLLASVLMYSVARQPISQVLRTSVH